MKLLGFSDYANYLARTTSSPKQAFLRPLSNHVDALPDGFRWPYLVCTSSDVYKVDAHTPKSISRFLLGFNSLNT